MAAVEGIGTGLPTGLAIVDAWKLTQVSEGAVEGFEFDLLYEEIVSGPQLVRVLCQVEEGVTAGETVSAPVGTAEVALAGDSGQEAPLRTHHGELTGSRQVLISFSCDTSVKVHGSEGRNCLRPRLQPKAQGSDDTPVPPV